MKVLFTCPTCDRPSQASLDQPSDWQCPACDQRQHFAAGDPALPVCAACGNHELYKQKDFPHRLGLLILTAAIVFSVFTYGWYEKWLTYVILIGSALFDGLLFLWVGDAQVCYRCHAYHRGFPSGPGHQPFDIAVGERYRQEKLRKERLPQ